MSAQNPVDGNQVSIDLSDQISKTSRKQRAFLPFCLTFIVCLATWIVLSGKFDAFHLSLGVVSCLIVAGYSGSLLIPPVTPTKLSRQWLRFIRYIPWLIYQIIKANIHVMVLVFHPRMMDLIDPKIIRFKSRISNEMGLFIFANSITLTPGTITVYVSIYGRYAVHAIDAPSGQSLPGEMERRVAQIFGE